MRGGGISAFPSMHAAMATLWAGYLVERSRWLAPIGLGFLAVILYLSVYTGWHYAVDGIASIAVVHPYMCVRACVSPCMCMYYVHRSRARALS